MPARTVVWTLAGNTEIDLTEADIADGAELTQVSVFGGVRVRAPAEVHVAVRSVTLVGGNRVGIADDQGTRLVRIRLYGLIGGVWISRP
jgi:predicted membrane protein